MNEALAFDLLLVAALLWLAGHGLFTRSTHASITLYICFGLVLSLAWARLGAPDLALAEAALGAGFIGGLLLKVAGGLPPSRRQARRREWAVARAVAGACMLVLLFVGIAGPVRTLATDVTEPRQDVVAALGASGASNAVTAVLLNFRGYDTLLEIAVLLVAGLACWVLPERAFRTLRPEPLLHVFVHSLIPLIVLVAAYLLWAGAGAPGGAFQAGVLLGAGGVVRLLAGEPLPMRGPLARLVLVLGLGVFLAAGLWPGLSGGRFLELPSARAGAVMLLIETAGMLSIGYLLTALFQGGRSSNA